MKMKRRMIAGVLSVTLCASVLTATSCSLFDNEQEQQVISAYDIAVKNGFQGTEQQWLASLHGSAGKDGKDGESVTVEDLYEASGFDGTLEEFIAYYMNQTDVSLREDNDTETIAYNTSSVVTICAGFQKQVAGRDAWGRVTTKTQVAKAEGSGVIYSINRNGASVEAYIVTNYHVLYGGSAYTDNQDGLSTDIYVYTYGAKELFDKGDSNGDGYLDEGASMGDTDGDGIKATYVGGEMDYDIAILKIEDSEYLPKTAITAAKFGNSDEVVLGEKTFAIGNANGHGISVTSGSISVTSETITMNSTDGLRMVSYRVMRTDAAINSGNSGGGLFNAKGELIGITNAKNIQDQTDNMGYALPITKVKMVMDNILSNAKGGHTGYVVKPWLGIETYLQSSVATLVGGELKIRETFVVTKVFTGETDTEKAGAGADKFQYRDVILGMKIGNGDWCTFERRYQFEDRLLTVRKGDTVVFKVLRENVETEVEILFDKDEYFVIPSANQ